MTLGKISLRFHSAGWPFMAIFAVVTVLFAYIAWPLFFIGLILTAWCFYFFRDPPRVTPIRDGLIISPADGQVLAIQTLAPDASLGLGDEQMTRISIFLNVFDVHVNRMPADGTVIARHYRKGAFVNASLDKASEDNERMALVVKLGGAHRFSGRLMGVVQIAGLVARRIVCGAQEGQVVLAGQRYGIIRFGSRADIYLPIGLTPLIAVGQYMIGGETVIADAAATESMREGVVRA
jgi:phosphatidylserine decarboxylase